MVLKDTEGMLLRARSKMVVDIVLDRAKKQEAVEARFNPVIEEMLLKARSSFIVSFVLDKLSQGQDTTETND